MKVLRLGLLRVLRIAWVLGRHAAAHLVGPRAVSWPWLAHRLPMAGQPGPERLRMLFEDVGGTFIKFGQMLALQPDILPIEYCNALFKLLDRVEPFGYGEVERIVTEELGRPPEEVFDAFDREPLATASVGQVHVAWLEGDKVAVKVQRPNVELEFGNDIRVMTVTMKLIRGLRVKPLYWMLEPMSEFVGWTREELDYRNEAGYSERLRGFARDMPGQEVPKVYLKPTTRRLLVVEFLEGVTLLDYLRARDQNAEVVLRRLEKRGFDRRRFSANVIDNFLGNAFRHGIYHADLHPANLMILEDSVVGYIDFGITGVMSPYARQHLMKMTLALALGDMEMFNAEFLKVTVWNERSDLQGFRDRLERLAQDWYRLEGQQKKLAATFTRIMTEMLHVSRETDVMPERDVIKYIRSSIAIDGLISRFEPEFDLGSYLADSCTRYLHWHSRAEHFNVEKMLDFSGAGAQLLHDGPSRSARVLDRLADGEIVARLHGVAGNGRAALRTRVVQLSVMVVAASWLAASTDVVSPGLNLWTAQVLFASATLAMLLATLRKLAWT